MDSIVRAYNYVFYERADPRCKDWLFMTTPWPLACIITTYLLLIKFILPAYMRNRAAYELRSTIKWYNIFMIIINAVCAWGIATSGWTTTYHFGCVLPDYSNNPEPLRMLNFMWWTITIKLFEFLETIFFVLRKRDRQASFLHIYHHIVTLIIVWTGVKYVGGIIVAKRNPIMLQPEEVFSKQSGKDVLNKKLAGGLASFAPLLNNSVHVVMYSYYLGTAEGGPKLKAFLFKHKKWLTVLQMTQITAIVCYSMIVFLPSCPAPMGVAWFYLPNALFINYLFYRFFRENYKKNAKETTKKRKGK